MTKKSLRENFVQSRGIKVLCLLALSSFTAISQSLAQISLRVGVVALAGLENSTLASAAEGITDIGHGDQAAVLV